MSDGKFYQSPTPSLVMSSTTNNVRRKSGSGSLPFFMKQCVSVRQLQQSHSKMITNCLQHPNFLLSKIIVLKDFCYASLFFARIANPNEYSYNIMIRALARTWQKHNLAIELYYRMKLSGFKPDNFTYPFLFASCASVSALIHGKIAQSMACKTGFGGHCHVNNCLITMYARCGEVAEARKVFDEFSGRDLVSWNSMISGYSKMGFASKAVELFYGMRDGEGLEPEEMTLVSILGACGDSGNLKLGRWVEEFVGKKKKMELNSYMGSALINMYGKCGDVASARRVFDGIADKDVVIWNAMITGYAQNGESAEAIKLYGLMMKTATIPNAITMIEVLSSCSSIGALDLGKWIEASASERGLAQDVYVGSALIDMYAKCGSLGNARRVFESMHLKNEVSWNTMISALAFHGQAHEALSLLKLMSEEHSWIRPNDVTLVGALSACVHAGLVDEGRELFSSMSSSFGLNPKIEHYSCMVDLLARAGHLNEAWEFIENMPDTPDEIMLGSLLGACEKRRDDQVLDRVLHRLLEMEPSNSGNYVTSSRLFARSRRWDDSARMRTMMRERRVLKTPGCSWIEIESKTMEFHSGRELDAQSAEIYQTLVKEMKIKRCVPMLPAHQ